MKIAAVNWKLREIAREGEFYDHLREVLDSCRGCNIVVLPELFGLELLGGQPVINDTEIPARLAAHYHRIESELVEWMHAGLDEGAVTEVLIGGSNPIRSTAGFVNRSSILAATPHEGQDKVVLTEWERSIGLVGGKGLNYIKHDRVGVTICLDAEFPGSARALAEAGALFIAVPAWTETMHGFRRVRWACQARAVENQVCVIHSSLVGKVGSEECHGSSAIICPPHEPFPLDPILAETQMDEEGVAIADVKPDDLLKCRETGEVRNWRDRGAGDWTVTKV